MNRLELILSAILTLSVLINIGLFAYVRGLLVRLISVSEELSDLQIMVEAFTEHLQNVYELESFYGDETLENLLNHAISFNEQMYTFDYIISFTEDEEANTEEELNEEPPQEEN